VEPSSSTAAVPLLDNELANRARVLLERERQRRKALLVFVTDQLAADQRRYTSGDRDARYHSEDRAVLLGLRERHYDALAEVDAAFGRLRDGTYGACELCAKPIGRDRLEVMPAATTCLACHLQSPERGVAASRWVVGDVVVPPRWTRR
jgi:DnaK suppressor protein